MNKSRILAYVLGIILIISGISLFIYLLIDTITDVADLGEQVIAPGEANLYLEKEGKYVIFYESKSVIDGKIYNTESFNISNLDVDIYNAVSKKPVQLKVSNGSSNYHIGNRHGESIYKFEIEEPGEYTIKTKINETGEQIVLSITENFIFGMVGSIFLMVIILLVLPPIGAAIIVLTILKQKKII